MQRRPALTLIELVVALAIAVLLGGIAYAAYTGIAARSRDNAAASLADELAQNIAHYEALTGSAPSFGCYVSWTTVVSSLGPYAELPSSLPALFPTPPQSPIGQGQLSAGQPSCWGPPSNGNPVTFMLIFEAQGGTGKMYCRDDNGLAQIAAFNSTLCP